MRDILKEMMDENTKEVREDVAKRILQTGTLSLDDVARCAGLPLSAVKELKEQMTQTT